MASQLVRDPPETSRYDEDFYLWALEQADLLRRGRFADLDLANLVEEVEGLGISLRNAVLSNTRVVIEHLLKLSVSRDSQPRNGWRASIREHRRRIELDLTASLRRDLEAELAKVFQRACRDAAGGLTDYGEDDAAKALPTTCPYTLEQILDHAFWPPQA